MSNTSNTSKFDMKKLDMEREKDVNRRLEMRKKTTQLLLKNDELRKEVSSINSKVAQEAAKLNSLKIGEDPNPTPKSRENLLPKPKVRFVIEKKTYDYIDNLDSLHILFDEKKEIPRLPRNDLAIKKREGISKIPIPTNDTGKRARDVIKNIEETIAKAESELTKPENQIQLSELVEKFKDLNVYAKSAADHIGTKAKRTISTDDGYYRSMTVEETRELRERLEHKKKVLEIMRKNEEEVKKLKENELQKRVQERKSNPLSSQHERNLQTNLKRVNDVKSKIAVLRKSK